MKMDKKNLIIIIGITIIILLIVNGVFLFKLTGYVIKENDRNKIESEEENTIMSKKELIDEKKVEEINTCIYGLLEEYGCNGIELEQKYQHSNCSFDWVFHDYCSYGCSDGKCNSESQLTKILVSYVIDGDTIQLSTGEDVRLIGINAPEVGEKCYEEAREFLEDFILEKEVTLESDVADKDQYERLLRYVFIDGHNVNYGMVYLGLAHKYEYGSNTKYSSWFEEAENEAKENNGCLWEKSEENYVNCFVITNFHFNAVGDDNYNLNNEYVTLENKCDYQIDMTNWTIKDETSSHLYYFPQFIIDKKESFTLYTGIGTNTNSKLYWGRQEGNYAAIWNNNGDTLFLRDKQGNLVLSESYEGF